MLGLSRLNKCPTLGAGVVAHHAPERDSLRYSDNKPQASLIFALPFRNGPSRQLPPMSTAADIVRDIVRDVNVRAEPPWPRCCAAAS